MSDYRSATPEEIELAIETLKAIEMPDLNYYHILTAIEALELQFPTPVDYVHKENEKAALIICPTCDTRTIINWEAHKEFHSEWFCKKCGQRLTLAEKGGEDR